MIEFRNGSLHALSGAYVVDGLDDLERAAFEQHLPGCPECQEEVDSLQETVGFLADTSMQLAPAVLRIKVLTGIRTIRPLPPETDAPVRKTEPRTEHLATVVPLRRRFRLNMLAAAAAVLAVAGIGVVVQQTNDNDSSTTQLTAADRVLAASDVTNIRVSLPKGGAATVSRSATLGKAVMVSEGMAALPEGKVYELWLRNAKGTMIPAGLLKGVGDHKQLLEGDAGKSTGAAITVEPAKGSTQPTTEPIAQFDFTSA